MKKVYVLVMVIIIGFSVMVITIGFSAGAQQYHSPNMVLVEGGTFQMENDNDENNEKLVHTVTVTSFYMGKYEVTQKEWREVMGTTVAQQRDMVEREWALHGKGDNFPIYYVSWYEMIEYCNKLSLKEGLTPAYRGSVGNITCDFNASGYRLPTEAEWEYAATGGNKDYLSYEYAGGNSVDAVAWYLENSGKSAHPVGTKQPNSLGLYDMSGNVWEWCWDWYWYGSYDSESQTDPRSVSSMGGVNRGGSWNSFAASVRSAYWTWTSGGSYAHDPSDRSGDLGFRLVRSHIQASR